MYDTILVPTDGSDHALRAAEHGSALAGWFEATVHVLNVIDLATVGGPFSAGGVGEEYVDRLEEDAEGAIEAAEAALGERDVHASVVRGRPADTILEYAGEHGADLIAMGTHGRTGLDRYVAGSVAERVVRHAEVPVLTAHAGEESEPAGGCDDILVPTDGSDPAEAAVEHAIAIATGAGARLHALNVVDISAVAAWSGDVGVPAGLFEQLESAGETATEGIASQARAAGLEAETAVREGHPANTVLEYAGEHGADLIAMGTRGRTGVSRYLLGSTTERVVRHADVPVLTVGAGERAEE